MATVLKTVLAQLTWVRIPPPPPVRYRHIVTDINTKTCRSYHSKTLAPPAQCLRNLRNIGPALEQKLQLIDVFTVADFMKSEPQELYDRLQARLGRPVDRCVLYCFAGARLDLPWHKCKCYYVND